ncbi:hypothetical protein [Streptomyces sp. NPDC048385]
MVILDADAHGYAASVLQGPLSEQHRAGLTRLVAVFDKVLPAVGDEYGTRYYAHVRGMAVLAAEVENLREKQRSANGRRAAAPAVGYAVAEPVHVPQVLRGYGPACAVTADHKHLPLGVLVNEDSRAGSLFNPGLDQGRCLPAQGGTEWVPPGPEWWSAGAAGSLFTRESR